MLTSVITVTSENEDGLLGFCLQQARWNDVVIVDFTEWVGILYNCLNTSRQ